MGGKAPCGGSNTNGTSLDDALKEARKAGAKDRLKELVERLRCKKISEWLSGRTLLMSRGDNSFPDKGANPEDP